MGNVISSLSPTAIVICIALALCGLLGIIIHGRACDREYKDTIAAGKAAKKQHNDTTT